mgnify:CR=1 FL=1
MELEVSFNENYCVEGQVERRRGATDSNLVSARYSTRPTHTYDVKPHLAMPVARGRGRYRSTLGPE